MAGRSIPDAISYGAARRACSYKTEEALTNPPDCLGWPAVPHPASITRAAARLPPLRRCRRPASLTGKHRWRPR